MPFVTLKSNFKISTGAKLAILLGIGIFLSVAVAAFAASSPDASIASKGIVQCGGAGEPLCTLCDLYSGTRRMINFLLFFLALPAATIAIIAAGIMFLISGGSESLRTQAKDTLKWAVIGLVIAFGGWVIVNTALSTLGYKGNWNDYSICRQFEGLIPNVAPSPGGAGGGGGNNPQGFTPEKANALLDEAGIEEDINTIDEFLTVLDKHNVSLEGSNLEPAIDWVPDDDLAEMQLYGVVGFDKLELEILSRSAPSKIKEEELTEARTVAAVVSGEIAPQPGKTEAEIVVSWDLDSILENDDLLKIQPDNLAKVKTGSEKLIEKIKKVASALPPVSGETLKIREAIDDADRIHNTAANLKELKESGLSFDPDSGLDGSWVDADGTINYAVLGVDVSKPLEEARGRPILPPAQVVTEAPPPPQNVYEQESSNAGADPEKVKNTYTKKGGVGLLDKVKNDWRADINRLADKYNLEQVGLTPDDVVIKIAVESDGIKNRASPAGSLGLMQVQLETARIIDKDNALGTRNLSDAQLRDKLLNDPKFNLELGIKHMADLMRNTNVGGDIDKMNAAYNGGDRIKKGPLTPSRDCPGSYAWRCEWENPQHTIPNTGYAETRNYVALHNVFKRQLNTR